MAQTQGLAHAFGGPSRCPDSWLPAGEQIYAGKVKEKSGNPGTGGFKTEKVNDLSYQNEGFPLMGYFVPACVGRWAWSGSKNCRRVAAAVVVANFLSASLNQEEYTESFFCRKYREMMI